MTYFRYSALYKCTYYYYYYYDRLQYCVLFNLRFRAWGLGCMKIIETENRKNLKKSKACD